MGGSKVFSFCIQKFSCFFWSVAKSLSIFTLPSCSVKLNSTILIEVVLREFELLICLWCILSINVFAIIKANP